MLRNPFGYKALLTYQQAVKIEDLINSLSLPLPPRVSRENQGGTKGSLGVKLGRLRNREIFLIQ